MNTQSQNAAPIPVETVTVLAFDPTNPARIAGIQHHKSKHNGRVTFVGGRRRLTDSILYCGVREISEEIGGHKGREAWIGRARVAMIANDRRRDIRKARTYEDVYEGLCHPDVAKVVSDWAFGCPDTILVAPLYGKPLPNMSIVGADQEAAKVVWIDTITANYNRNPLLSSLAAGHDVVGHAYRQFILPQILAHPSFWIQEVEYPGQLVGA